MSFVWIEKHKSCWKNPPPIWMTYYEVHTQLWHDHTIFWVTQPREESGWQVVAIEARHPPIRVIYGALPMCLWTKTRGYGWNVDCVDRNTHEIVGTTLHLDVRLVMRRDVSSKFNLMGFNNLSTGLEEWWKLSSYPTNICILINWSTWVIGNLSYFIGKSANLPRERFALFLHQHRTIAYDFQTFGILQLSRMSLFLAQFNTRKILLA